jgi:hypothetical protein
MTQLPTELIDYFSQDGGLGELEVLRRHPGVNQRVETPETRRTLLEWLAGDDPWSAGREGVLVHVLQFVRGRADAGEAPRVKPFLLHSEPRVRQAAYDFLLALYFPDRNPDAVFLLLTGMLSDESDAVRTAGALYAARTEATEALRGFLARWLALAPARGWSGTDSHAQVARLVNG